MMKKAFYEQQEHLRYPRELRGALNPFNLQESLVHVKLNNQIEEIPAHAFQNCVKLETVFLGQSVRIIRTQAFCKCQKLRTIEIRPGVAEICSMAF